MATIYRSYIGHNKIERCQPQNCNRLCYLILGFLYESWSSIELSFLLLHNVDYLAMALIHDDHISWPSSKIWFGHPYTLTSLRERSLKLFLMITVWRRGDEVEGGIAVNFIVSRSTTVTISIALMAAKIRGLTCLYLILNLHTLPDHLVL